MTKRHSPSRDRHSRDKYNKHHKSDKYKDKSSRDRSHKDYSRESKENVDKELNPEDENELLRKLMGIENFDTTKNKPHSNSALNNSFDSNNSDGTNYLVGSVDYKIKKKTKRKYRQYMNRRGGFNHPLSPVY